MADQFENIKPALESPGEGVEVVTPSDTQDLENVSRALYVGSRGALAVEMKDGSQGTFQGLEGGYLLPIRAKRVLATGTTASNIIAIF